MKNLAVNTMPDSNPLTKTEFVKRLRDIGKERYHDNCKFHHLLHSGKLNKGQVQAWALNRYYYQINIHIIVEKKLYYIHMFETCVFTRALFLHC